MIVDTSVLIAILFKEPEAFAFVKAIINDSMPRISAASFLEASMLLQAKKGDDGVRDLDLLIAKLKIQIVPFTETQSEIARRAFRQYGKGRHPASLNFGDCIAYALAKDQDEILLFKGNNFSQTDIVGFEDK